MIIKPIINKPISHSRIPVARFFHSIKMADKYKPSEHGGLREDGQPDKRTQQSQFAYGKVDPHKAGQEGGSIGGQATGSHSGGSAKGEFAHGKVDPHEAGRKGGQTLGDE